MTSYTDTQNRSIETPITNSTFRPELFVVPGGSYNSNVVYGSGVVALTPTYNGVTIKSSSNPLLFTTGKIRQHDKNVDFDIEITLDTTLPDPWFGQSVNELRIRTLPILVNQPGAYMNSLPLAEQGMPIFEDVEVLNPSGQNILPTQASNELQARLLFGSQLALLRYNRAVVPTAAAVPLSNVDLAPFFGLYPNIRIIVRGSYIAKANPTGH